MPRLFFVIFFVAAVVLGAVSVWVFTPTFSARAVEQANTGAFLASKLIALQVAERRTAVQRAVLRVASDPGTARVLEATRGRSEPASAESLAQVYTALSEQLPGDVRAELVLGLVNGSGGRVTRGGRDVAPETLELSKLVTAGADGALREAFGSPHVFHSARIGSSELVVGAPLVSESLMENLMGEGGGEESLVALGLVRDGRVLQATGPKKALVEKASELVPAPAARGVIVERGPVVRFGPLQLPMLTGKDVLRGAAPLAVASRHAMAATPYEVVAVLSVAPAMRAIAESQKFAILGFVFLTALGAVTLVLLSGSRKSKGALETPAERDERQEALEEAGAPNSSADELGVGDGAAAQAYAREPRAELGEYEAGEPGDSAQPEALGTAPAAGALEDPADAKTIASLAPAPGEEFRFAAPRASDSLEEVPRPIPPRDDGLAGPIPDAPRNAANSDEAHFEDVFRNFLMTRQQCGEPAEGLTYERFAQKLQKNREQLIARYNCRTVRFQVYVKEGKAALKATPIKE